MTPAEQQIRKALAAGPTPGPWHWEADEVKGDPTGRVRYQVTALGKTVTRVYYSSFEGGPTNAEADAKLIAACNPAALAELLAELDRLRAERKPLTEKQIKEICYIGPIYAPDGVVTRTPDEYRKVIQAARLRGIREAEYAHGITGD